MSGTTHILCALTCHADISLCFNRYATIGKMTPAAGAPAPAPAPAPAAVAAAEAISVPSQPKSVQPVQSEPEPASNVVYTSSGDAFRPTRRVRELAGGGSAQITALFGGDEDEQPTRPRPTNARVAQAPEPEPVQEEVPRRPAGTVVQSQANTAADDDFDAFGSGSAGTYEGVRNDAKMNNGFRPTRRVR